MSRIHDLGATLLRGLPAETAHRLTLWALAQGLGPVDPAVADPILETRLWNRTFRNPIGMAAGFDKNAMAIAGVLDMGLGFHEIGGVTPRAQTGNPRPRLFRLPRDGALINRMGFNNDGLDTIAGRLAMFREQHPTGRSGSSIVGANLAANTDSTDPIEDYVASAVRLAPLADFLTIDISCPNTRDGQIFLSPDPLAALLTAINDALAPASDQPGLAPARLIKLSPDTDAASVAPLVDVALALAIDGIVVANTSTDRPGSLTGRHASERGGLSGQPLFAPSTRLLHDVYRLTGGRVPLIGVGGIASGRDAYEKIRAGANLVQLYTGLVYQGPGLVGRLKRDLANCLRADGYAGLAQAVGAAHATIK